MTLFSCKAIKLYFSASPKTLPLRSDLVPVSGEAELLASTGEKKLKKIDIYICMYN